MKIQLLIALAATVLLIILGVIVFIKYRKAIREYLGHRREKKQKEEHRAKMRALLSFYGVAIGVAVPEKLALVKVQNIVR